MITAASFTFGAAVKFGLGLAVGAAIPSITLLVVVGIIRALAS